MSAHKMAAGAAFPALSWPAVGGAKVNLVEADGWRLLIVYRGEHCPICRRYLKTLNSMMAEFKEAGISVYAISADTQEKAEAEAREEDWQFPVGYELVPDQMHMLGLYVSQPRSAQETDRPFAEPGLFVVNPDGDVQVIDISNAPFARPNLKQVLEGLKFVMANAYPIRGRA